MTDWTENARTLVSADDVLSDAQRLVRIESENSPGNTKDVCAAVAEGLQPHGFEIGYVEPVDGFVSLTATHRSSRARAEAGPERARGRGSRPNGSMDTGPMGGGGRGRQADGCGSLDMKGPFASLIVAARSVVRASLPLRGELVLTAVADEEQGGNRGTGALVENGLSAGMAS